MKLRFFLPLLLMVPFTWAQNDMHANVNLQFRFANPGARALAMGGAFIGLADDTTAIFANPAGLVQLASTTLVVEASHTRRANNIPFYGGSIEQIGLQDFRFDLTDRDFPESSTSLPFAAYVRTGGRLKWGVFLAEQGDFSRTFQTEGVSIPPFSGGRFVSVNTFEFFPPGDHFIDLKLRSAGFSVAWSFTERLSWGMTFSYNQFRYRGNSMLFIPNLEMLFPDINFSPRDLEAIRPLYGMTFAQVDVDGKDTKPSAFGGILYTPTPRFTLGLSYKLQPSFDYDFVAEGRDDNFEPEIVLQGQAPFNVPDSYGLGISFKPTDVFLLSLEVNRVAYSELSEDFVPFFRNDDDPTRVSQSVADTTEYHLGMEYFITALKYPLALRAGYWFEPYHALQNTSLDTQIIFRFLNQFGDFVQASRQTVFLQRFAEDLNHITFGFGLSVGRKFTLDMAADLTNENKIYSLSSIYRF